MTSKANVLGIKCHVSISSQIGSLIRSTVEKFGSEIIDILVNNATVAFNKRLVDTVPEVFLLYDNHL